MNIVSILLRDILIREVLLQIRKSIISMRSFTYSLMDFDQGHSYPEDLNNNLIVPCRQLRNRKYQRKHQIPLVSSLLHLVSIPYVPNGNNSWPIHHAPRNKLKQVGHLPPIMNILPMVRWISAYGQIQVRKINHIGKSHLICPCSQIS